MRYPRKPPSKRRLKAQHDFNADATGCEPFPGPQCHSCGGARRYCGCGRPAGARRELSRFPTAREKRDEHLRRLADAGQVDFVNDPQFMQGELDRCKPK